MPENLFDKLNMTELWALVSVLVSGGIGGCAAAFAGVSQNKDIITGLTIVGYMITGMFGATVMFTFAISVLDHSFASLSDIVLVSSVAGFGTAISLFGTNMTFKFILKKLGLEIDVKIKRVDKKKP